MRLIDFLATPFLIYLGITLFIIGTISMFFMQRLNDQNHKLVSMLGLVSTMAEEVNYLKHKSQSMPSEKNNVQQFTEIRNEIKKNSTLIDVSDNESDSDSNNDDMESEDTDIDSDDSESEDSIVSEYNDDLEIHVSENDIDDIELIPNDIKIINISEDLNFTFESGEVENIEEKEEKIYTLDENKDDDDDILIDEMQTIATQNISNILNSIKTIKMDDSELKEDSVKEYKKMSLNELRSLVLDKKLTHDSSKLKKHELMKLLETNVTSVFQNTPSNQLSLSEINI